MMNVPVEWLGLDEWHLLADEGIALSNEQITRSLRASQSVRNHAQQWQIYLHTLALLGLEEWLQGWAAELDVVDTHCSVFLPAYASWIPAACDLQIGTCQVCVLSLGQMMDTVVHLPRATLELPNFAPQLYVLMEVLEEEMEVRMVGCLPRDRLLEQHQSQPLTLINDWIYELPIEWFDTKSSHLFLELHRLISEQSLSEPQGIAAETEILSPIATPFSRSLPNLRTRLTPLLPQLRDPDSNWQQILSWQDGATVLSDPELADWLYGEISHGEILHDEILHGEITAVSPTAIATEQPLHIPDAIASRQQPIYQTTVESAINAALWFQDRLDSLAQELSWVLLPTFTTASALRSTENPPGMTIPTNARGISHQFQMRDAVLNLQAIAWPIQLTTDTPTPETAIPETLAPTLAPDTQAWTLLVLLNSTAERSLPPGIRLCIRDEHQLLVEQTLDETAPVAYLYAQAGGYVNERFWVTVNLPDGYTATFPPITFTLT